MKTEQQKARIRRMLAAESGQKPDKDWDRFKAKLRGELSHHDVPGLEIREKRRINPWLMPVAALVIAGIAFFAWRIINQEIQNNPQLVQNSTEKKIIRAGETFRQGRREIRFLSGTATLSDRDGKISIDARKLAADFSLREKTNLEIKHPLVTVLVTGTAFRFEADAAGGTIRLREGSLRILPASDTKAVILRAPARFVFSRQGHKQLPDEEKTLYRYELASGEVLYAEQISTNTQVHQVQLLGGGKQTIAVAEIIRLEAVP